MHRRPMIRISLSMFEKQKRESFFASLCAHRAFPPKGRTPLPLPLPMYTCLAVVFLAAIPACVFARLHRLETYPTSGAHSAFLFHVSQEGGSYIPLTSDRCRRGIAANERWLRLRGGGPNLYEILGVGEDASAQEIKTAYKRSALLMHPDKNIDTPEESAIQFRKLQHAYEVLGDASSRARYDASSRSSYSVMNDGGEEEDDEELVGLSRFFGANAYTGYNEEPGGFFSVYGDIFQKIASLEPELQGTMMHAQAWGEERRPPFGDMTSDYKDIVEKFYNVWSEFSSAREFRSECVWDLQIASNRWERRRMEGDG